MTCERLVKRHPSAPEPLHSSTSGSLAATLVVLLQSCPSLWWSHSSAPSPPHADVEAYPGREDLLDGMKHPLAQERKSCPAITLSFDQFELGDMALDHAVIDPPGEASSRLASLSFSTPAAKDRSSGSLLFATWASQASRRSPVRVRSHWANCCTRS
jgi:hypothetical protein